MKDFVFQNRLSDCGFCTLKIALTSFSKNSSYLRLKAPKRLGNYSFLELIECAKECGYLIKGYQIPIRQTPPKESILLFLKRGSFHYVYLKEIHERYLFIYDPILGKRKMKYQTFYRNFTGYYLKVIRKRKEVKIKKEFISGGPYFIRYGFLIFLLIFLLWLLR